MIAYPTFIATLVAKDVDLDALAADADVSIACIHNYMNGRTAPSLPARARLARALGVPADELFALAPDMEQALPKGRRRFVTDQATLRAFDGPRGVA